MMVRFSILLVSLLSCSSTSHAFVPVRPSLAGPVVVSSSNQQQHQQRQPHQQHRMIMDPSHFLESASTFLADAMDAAAVPDRDYIPGTSGEVSYSRASYYTILGLYALSFPGLYSTVKRSTSAKIKRRTFVRYGGDSVMSWVVCFASFFFRSFFSLQNFIRSTDRQKKLVEVQSGWICWRKRPSSTSRRDHGM
jgi:hypothetical protein